MNRFADHWPTTAPPIYGRTSASVSCGVGASSADELPEDVVRRLEELDDTMFAALEGDAAALDRSVHLWHAVTTEFEPKVVAESREQYLRRAEAVWNESRVDPVGSLPRAFAAIEVMNLLAD
jgi:hypothetical protein